MWCARVLYEVPERFFQLIIRALGDEAPTGTPFIYLVSAVFAAIPQNTE